MEVGPLGLTVGATSAPASRGDMSRCRPKVSKCWRHVKCRPTKDCCSAGRRSLSHACLTPRVRHGAEFPRGFHTRPGSYHSESSVIPLYPPLSKGEKGGFCPERSECSQIAGRAVVALRPFPGNDTNRKNRIEEQAFASQPPLQLIKPFGNGAQIRRIHR